MKGKKDNFANSASAWFLVLDRARHERDFTTAAEAQEQLKRLGVSVKFHRRKVPQP